ncbi:MAG: hypothetical protein ACXW3O_00350 [Brevundimonas sp.]
MLSPLKPLLCRHDFYWSERHRAERCRGCGKTQAAASPHDFSAFEMTPGASSRLAETQASFVAEAAAGPTTAYDFLDAPAMGLARPAIPGPTHRQPSAKVLKAEALERRENLLALLDWIADGGQPTRKEALDALLALIEDGHSADPVLFGVDAADRFARLHGARRDLIF